MPHASASSSSPRSRRGVIGTMGLLGIVLVGVVLSACSSSPPAASTSSSVTTSATTNITGSGGASDSAQIRSLSSAVQAGKDATFKATYTTHDANGSSESLTLEQKPPKSVFATGSTSVINDGNHTYFCTATGGARQCVSETGAGANPLASITAIFDPSTVLSEFQAAEAAAAAHSSGYSLAFSDGTYAGLATKCVNFGHGSQTVKYCVTNSGVLAYASSAGNTFELTGFSASPPDSDFALPAGATVVTVPNVSIPSTP